jgi:hypothetical protein
MRDAKPSPTHCTELTKFCETEEPSHAQVLAMIRTALSSPFCTDWHVDMTRAGLWYVAVHLEHAISAADPPAPNRALQRVAR